MVYTWIEDWLKNRTQRVQFGGDSSNWIPVLSGVPQGSVLGPILFFIYINDIDDRIESKILKFADDTKLYRRIINEEDVTKLQEDLATLCKWSREWLMLFNVDKCKILHLGHGNKMVPYTMNGVGLQAVQEEVDLGIVIQEDLKWAKQCAKVVGKANRTLGLIKRCFGHLTEDVFLKLYKSLVRPKLEYAVQAWRPHLQKDINLLEKVQRRATKLIYSLRINPMMRRLKALKLTTLEIRRTRGDLIEVFKIFKGFDQIDSGRFFEVVESYTRGHNMKIFKTGCHLDCRKYFFSNRVVNLWNKLPSDVIACDTIGNFKARLDKLICQGFI
jgi:ribonuclease P/MRP protein subunit RPP40